MKLLAIETSSDACSIALDYDQEIFEIHEVKPLQHAQTILVNLNEIIKRANISLNQLDAIALGCGPGSFTGVRIATSVVKAVAFAMQIPVIPVSSLATLAQVGFETFGWQQLLVAMDARIQEIYWGTYVVNDQGLASLVFKETVCSPLDIMQPKEGDWYGIGDAWAKHADKIPYQPKDTDTQCLPTARAVLSLARFKYQKKDWVSADHVSPVYLREQVAKKNG